MLSNSTVKRADAGGGGDGSDTDNIEVPLIAVLEEDESSRIYSCTLGVFNLRTDSAYRPEATTNNASTLNNGNALVCRPDSCAATLNFVGSDAACQAFVTDKECTQRCLHGWSSNSNGFRAGEGSAETDATRRTVAHYACEQGIITGDAPLLCEAELCTQTVPVGEGFDTACKELRTNGTCTHRCKHGFVDNNAGNGQVYDCKQGVFHGTLLTCEAESCAHLVANTPYHDSGCSSLVSGGNCTQRCSSGYGDVITGQTEQDHSCMAGELSGALLVCEPLACNASLDHTEAYVGECLALRTDETCTYACGAGYSNAPFLWNTRASKTYPAETAGPLETTLSCPGGILTGTPLACFPQNCTANFTAEGGSLNEVYFDIHDCNHLMSGGSCELKCIDGWSSNNPNGSDSGQVYICPNGILAAASTNLECTPPLASTGFTTAQTVGTSIGALIVVILLVLLILCQVNQWKRQQQSNRVSATLPPDAAGGGGSGVGVSTGGGGGDGNGGINFDDDDDDDDDLIFQSGLVLDSIAASVGGGGGGSGAGLPGEGVATAVDSLPAPKRGAVGASASGSSNMIVATPRKVPLSSRDATPFKPEEKIQPEKVRGLPVVGTTGANTPLAPPLLPSASQGQATFAARSSATSMTEEHVEDFQEVAL